MNNLQKALSLFLLSGILGTTVKAQLYIQDVLHSNPNSLIYVNGDVVSNSQINAQQVTHNGLMEVKGNWYNIAAGDKKVFTDASQGEVLMSGALQTFNGSNTRFPNLTLAGSGKKIQYTNIEIATALNLTDRELDVNGNIASVLSALPVAILYSEGGYVNTSANANGWLLRNVEKETDYVYPLGNINDGQYRFRPLVVKAASKGNVYSQFQNYNPGQDRLDASRRSNELTNVNPLYYHSMKTDDTASVTTVRVQHPYSVPNDAKYTTMAIWSAQQGQWQKLLSTGPLPVNNFPTNDNLFYADNVTLSNNSTTPINLANEKVDDPLKIPNVITPDGNGKNDFFVVKGLERFPNSELVIVNRWGHEVYRTKNYDNRWNADGLNAGVYFYILKLHQPDGKIVPYKGYIEVLKK